MKNVLKKGKVGILLVCIILTLTSTTALAGYSSSGKQTASANGYTYQFGAAIQTNYGSAAAHTSINGPMSGVPEGYMGVLCRLYNSSGTLLETSDWMYNDTKCIGMEFTCRPYTTYSGLYYSCGQVQIYNGNGYDTYTTYRSPNLSIPSQSSSSSKDTMTDELSISTFKINANGDTYGSGLSEIFTGKEPNLIAAYGKDGTFGYVYATDLNAQKANTLKQALETEVNNNSRFIPLYESDGETVIGKFEVAPAGRV